MSFKSDFEHLKIELKDIRLATNDFGEKPIGIGGFGKVFRGELSLPEGKKMVAFKRLDRKHGQGDVEFWREIMMLAQYKHQNLISLLHFCNEDGERILVYEYAPRGSLDRYLGDTSLTWIQRLKICHGAACGLNYLHDPKIHQRVLHRDVKSSNILLDENFNAKISDFGLSKIGPANQQYTYLVSNIAGTPGYCDPVYLETGSLSKESDIYSFGVVLFEIMCGRHCFEYCKGETKILVPMWKKCYEEKRLDDIVCNDLKEQIDRDSLITFSSIAYRCLNRYRKERPKMVEVMNELEIALDHQEMSQDVGERNKFEERVSTANQAATRISWRSRNELALVLSQGILIEGGDHWVSQNKNGEYYELISGEKCFHSDHNCSIYPCYEAKQFSRSVLQDHLNSTTQEKDENSEGKCNLDMQPNIDLDIDGGKEFPSDYAEIIKWSEDNIQWRTNKELYHLLRKGFLIKRNSEQWFSISKSMKKRPMLSATTVFKEGPKWKFLLGRKSWTWKSLPESRFQLVAECCEMKSFSIQCEFEPEFLSPETTYACYLVYKLPTKLHFMFKGLVHIDDIIRQPSGPQFVDLIAPTYVPLIRDYFDESHIPLRTRQTKGHPKLRKDGWMEIQIWDFKTSTSLGTIQMYLRLRNCNKGNFRGLLVQGIEFRPAKVSFMRYYSRIHY